ncbi:H(+)/Cl(-) exchange transporter ClcA [Microbulbifer aggregans]|uniref:H(+)/Cl(-) exchange transporter ClcA n=1 Tax=Microbulbifer aggregans TaxID=1769779 RepID=A0A1C9W8U9_9GAMM|nr:chloride channel protein [Microbulbifer aggregans]AOS97589.1 H(+)/Cl(-) exchange transporter ClcA [Microbulbifer aggregans]
MRQTLAIILCGTLIGTLGALFLSALKFADSARIAAINLAGTSSLPPWLAAVLVCLTGAAVAAYLAYRLAPDAPQTSLDRPGKETATPASQLGGLSANFAGTSLAVGAGFALGPERPAIQMGAIVGRTVCRILRLKASDRDIFTAAAGGAGVATMFNSPLGCAAYTVEAVLKRVDFKRSVIALGMGGISVAVARLISGNAINFPVGEISGVKPPQLLLCLLLGCLMAFFAKLHLQLIMVTSRGLISAMPRPVLRAALIGGLFGILAWHAPALVGTGEQMTQSILDGGLDLRALVIVFLIRFLLGPLSLAASVPGGYFTPVLLLGAAFGAMFGSVANEWIPMTDISPTVFALTGMAVALATVANAPFTGILLVIETTGAFSLSLPMTVAVLGAVAVGRLLHQPTLTHGLEQALNANPPKFM